MNNISIVFCLMTLAMVSCRHADSPNGSPITVSDPEQVGMSPKRLSLLDSVLVSAVNNGEIPGTVALVLRHGKVVYHKSFGVANERGDKLTEDAIFRIASQTKAITATAVMMLWEEGHFRLDDPINKYIPEFGQAMVLDTFNESDSTYTARPAKNQITIRSLLTHTSGIGYGPIDGDERMKKIFKKANVSHVFTTGPETIEAFVKRLAGLPLHHEPGERFTYSMGLDVLGYFIERISGMPLDEFLRIRIFDPLEMEDTWFYLNETRAKSLVSVLSKEGDTWQNAVGDFFDNDYPIKGAKTFFGGGGGLSSTALDYAKFLQLYLNGGVYNGKRLLSPTTVETIMANQVGHLFPGVHKGHGLVFGLITDKGVAYGGEGSEGTFEWAGYFNTQYFADPKEQLIGILLKQTTGPIADETAWKFRQVVGASLID